MLLSIVQQSESVIYIYIHTHTYIYIYTDTYIHVYTHIHIYTQTHIYMYTHTHTHTHTHIYISTLSLASAGYIFGHLMQRADSLEKTLMLGKTKGKWRRGQQRTRWLDGITDAMEMTSSSSS